MATMDSTKTYSHCCHFFASGSMYPRFHDKNSRYGVVTTPTPRMTTYNSLEGEPTTLDRPILLECLEGIGGAGRGEATSGGFEGRDTELIEAHKADERQGEDALKGLRQSAQGSF